MPSKNKLHLAKKSNFFISKAPYLSRYNTPNLGCCLILFLCICCVTKHLEYKVIYVYFDAKSLTHEVNQTGILISLNFCIQFNKSKIYIPYSIRFNIPLIISPAPDSVMIFLAFAVCPEPIFGCFDVFGIITS